MPPPPSNMFFFFFFFDLKVFILLILYHTGIRGLGSEMDRAKG